ncbi:MAG: dephospho-CoA kinase [Dethiobacter sp.]|jgi:dephospho-CoA kinase|nr:dephospho-CoA kinase [Dethiobacter sp.]
MLILGLTGGIATGKSTAAAIFEKMGAYRIDADRLAREVVQPGKPAWQAIVSHFGPGVLYFDRQLNRHALASVIFNDPNERHVLEAITHPQIRKLIDQQIIKARQSGAKVALLEVPLLYEVGLDRVADKVLVVVTDEATQLKRMMKRDNLTENEARLRVKAQMSLAEKAKQADFVIYNTGTPAELDEQAKRLWLELTAVVIIPETLKDNSVVWKSDNEEVAVVSDSGIVSPVGPGTATISVTAANGAGSAHCSVTVQEPPQVSVYIIDCTAGGESTVAESNEGGPLTLKIRPKEIRDFGYGRAKLNVAVTDKPPGSTVRLMTKDKKGLAYDAAALGCIAPDEGFAMTKDYSEDIELSTWFDKPGAYTISFILVDLENNAEIAAAASTSMQVRPQQKVSSYKVTCDTAGLKFVAGTAIPLPVTVRAAEVNDFGYERVRFNVRVLKNPAGAEVRLQTQDSRGYPQDAAILGYFDRANGFPLSKDHNKTIEFESCFDKTGEYSLSFTLVNLDNEAELIAEHSVNFSVQKLPEASKYELSADTSALKFLAGSETGTVIPLVIMTKEVKDIGYNSVKLTTDIIDRPHDGRAQLLAADSHGGVYDAAATNDVQEYFSLGTEYNHAIDFNAKFNKPGYYTIRFSLTDSGNGFQIACLTKVIRVFAIPQASEYEFVCNTKGLKFVADPEKTTSLPVTLRTREVKDFGYDNVRLNVAVTGRPVDAKAQLFARSSRGRVYDAAVLGYWGAVTGFAVSRDFNTTMEINVKFDTVGSYTITFTLADLNDESNIITSGIVLITVEAQPEVSTYEIAADTEGLVFVAGSETGTVLNITLSSKKVKDLGYESATLYTVITRRPARSKAQLLAADSKGQLYDTLLQGFWGPAEGFQLDREFALNLEFHAKFDTPGIYTVTFTLADKKAGGAVIAKSKVQARVKLEAAESGATQLVLNRHSLKLIAGGTPAVLVATPAKESKEDSKPKA